MNSVVNLDIGTLMFSLSMTMLMASGLLTALWVRHRDQIGGIGHWALAATLVSVGSLLFLLQNQGLGVWSVLVSNTSVHVGVNLLALGMHRFGDRPLGPIAWLSGAMLGVTTLLLTWSAVAGTMDVGERVIASTLCIAAAIGFLLRGITPSVRGSLPGWILFVVSIVILALSGPRVAHAALQLVASPTSTHLLEHDPVQSVFIGIYFISGITLIFALILLVPHWLHQREQELHGRIELLYRELSHRVGNNLNVILNYLDLAKEQSTDDYNRTVLAQSQSMVAAVSAVHHALGSRQDPTDGLLLHDHLAILARQTLQSFQISSVHLCLDLDPVRADARTLKNFVLIVNELITNACKYAFSPSRPGTLTLRLVTTPAGDAAQELRLEVEDTGPGLSAAWGEGEAEGSGFGQALVSHCTDDLGGTLEVNTGPSGTHVVITCTTDRPDARSTKGQTDLFRPAADDRDAGGQTSVSRRPGGSHSGSRMSAPPTSASPTSASPA